MTSDRAEVQVETPGEVARRRIREVRKARKLSPTAAAERYGDVAMTATVLMNIEAGRRQSVTVDELVRLAYVLDVPVEALLVGPGAVVEVAPGVSVDSGRFLRWLRGQEALDGADADHYRAVAAEALGDAGRGVPQELRDEFLARAQAAFDGFFADSEEIHHKTRQQVRGVLSDVREAISSGKTTDELLGVIDTYLNRLE
ncbi:helix-turn-helix domain-containing protein [Catenuloplanes japonicus]|uniref:helix-turn-helix domain-containing protein n=1 Tax=Catenuloplanes japonicus TaxID=33876 RepID=UPI0012FB5A9C|nr:helix-turn-helix transcriptional regulator [Catenuloplanes japonicus]